jgi:DNA polymerase-1
MEALREGANLPMQGTAQGTIKLTMSAVDQDLEDAGLYKSELVYPLLQIHDELLFEVREDVLEDVSAITTYRFENCVRLSVPLKASAASADSWGLLEK